MSIRVRLPLCVLFLICNLVAKMSAQSTEAAVKARLTGKELYLRGLWGDTHLHFTADGTLSVPSDPLSFTVAGFRLKSTRFTKDGVILYGKRVGLELKGNSQKSVELEPLDIEIAKPVNDDYGPALDAIFTEDLRLLVPSLPTYWQRYAQCTLFPAQAPASPPLFCSAKGEVDAKARQVGGTVTAPKLEKKVDVKYSSFAREAKYTGATLISMIVDTTGNPTYLRVVSPIGLGMDEEALAAVQQWHLTPAMEDGEPVPAQVQVQVEFHLYKGFHLF